MLLVQLTLLWPSFTLSESLKTVSAMNPSYRSSFPLQVRLGDVKDSLPGVEPFLNEALQVLRKAQSRQNRFKFSHVHHQILEYSVLHSPSTIWVEFGLSGSLIPMRIAVVSEIGLRLFLFIYKLQCFQCFLFICPSGLGCLHRPKCLR